MSSLVQRTTTEQPRPTTDGALDLEGKTQYIKDFLAALPEGHSMRIHGTQHVDLIGSTFEILKVDPECEWCRADFKLEV